MSYDVSDPVPIPADIDRPDKILAGLTARQGPHHGAQQSSRTGVGDCKTS